jgi:hypothetical protein
VKQEPVKDEPVLPIDTRTNKQIELEKIQLRADSQALKVIEPKTYASGERKSSRMRFHPEPMPVTSNLHKKPNKPAKKKKPSANKEDGMS